MYPISRRSALMATGAALGLCACGGDDVGGANDKDVKLRMTVWTSNEAHLSLFQGIADDYMKDHPNVTAINYDALPFESYSTTLTTQIAGGNAPDLAWIFETDAPDFVASKALLDLSDVLAKAPDYDVDELVPSAKRLWEKDGRLLAYPFSTSPFGMFVNKDLFAKAGVALPSALRGQNQWTWETAFTSAAQIKAKGAKSGLVFRDFDYKGWDNLATLWRGWGADPWSEDGTACTFAAQEMNQALTRLHRAIFHEHALPAPGTSADFFAGEAGMTVTQISRASLLKDSKFEWDLVPLPSGPREAAAVIGQAGIGVLRKGPHPQVAADFLAFFTNKRNSARLAEFFPPPRKSLLTADAMKKSNPLLSVEQLNDVVIDGIQKGRTKSAHKGYAEINQKVRAALDPLWNEGAKVQPVLDGVCAAISPLLSK